MAPLPQHRSQRGGRRAQADEHSREAGHEQDGSDENVAPRLRLALVDQSFDAGAREIAKIRRRERQHARRNKGKKARAKRGGKGNVSHGVTDGASTTARQMGARSRRPRDLANAATGPLGPPCKRAARSGPGWQRVGSASSGGRRGPASRRPPGGDASQAKPAGIRIHVLVKRFRALGNRHGNRGRP